MREIIPDRFKNCKIYNKKIQNLGSKNKDFELLDRKPMLIKMLEEVWIVWYWIR